MEKITKHSVLEKEVQRFFECGWLLQIIKGKYYLRNPSASNMIYSKEYVFNEGEFETPFDYGNRKEREGAYRVLTFIESNPDLLEKYKQKYPDKIVYQDTFYDNLIPNIASGIADVTSEVLDVTSKVIDAPIRILDFTANTLFDVTSNIFDATSDIMKESMLPYVKSYPWEEAYKFMN